jgi:hypothetical protein
MKLLPAPNLPGNKAAERMGSTVLMMLSVS